MLRSKSPKPGASPAPQKCIFISYRRSDSAGYAGRLYDFLKSYFGDERIFFDVDAIQPGVDFQQKIAAELDQSEAMLVMIGSQWLDSRDQDGSKRLENPRDYVRYEIEKAWARTSRSSRFWCRALPCRPRARCWTPFPICRDAMRSD